MPVAAATSVPATSSTKMTLPARAAPALRSTALRAVPGELSVMPCVVILRPTYLTRSSSGKPGPSFLRSP